MPPLRLLNVHKVEVETISTASNEYPKYAILSHVWQGDNEFTFEDFANPDAKSKSGWKKTVEFCQMAELDGFDYAWIDTCCIQKTSSVELGEAINSMFDYYASAATCYAYLEDVDLENPQDQTMFGEEGEAFRQAFTKSRWFERGWTLQELIAPETVIFYNDSWNEIGSKKSLMRLISKRTNIPEATLLNRNELHFNSVAGRMSWAALRKTTRIEDMAYCLLGIFGVNMPLMYGEKERAFERLQQEIMKISGDQSLFAWGLENTSKAQEPIQQSMRQSVFAKSPFQFLQSRHVVSTSSKTSPPYQLTNRGLDIQLPILPILDRREGSEFFAVLECMNTTNPNMFLAMMIKGSETDSIFDRTIARSQNTEILSRATFELSASTVVDAATRRVFVRGSNMTTLALHHPVRSLVIRDFVLQKEGYTLSDSKPSSAYQKAVHSDCADNSHRILMPFKYSTVTYLYENSRTKKLEVAITINEPSGEGKPTISVDHGSQVGHVSRANNSNASDVANLHIPSFQSPIKATVERKEIHHHSIFLVTIAFESESG